MLIYAQKSGGYGDLTPKMGTISTNPQKDTNESVSYEPPCAKIRQRV